jgi:hypothetical protein
VRRIEQVSARSLATKCFLSVALCLILSDTRVPTKIVITTAPTKIDAVFQSATDWSFESAESERFQELPHIEQKHSMASKSK